MSRAARAWSFRVWMLAPVLGVVACSGTTVTPVKTPGVASTYKIECVRMQDCLAEAQRTCNGKYQRVHTTETANAIPESDLPGLNARTQMRNNTHNDLMVGRAAEIPAGGPGIESDEPMPVAAIVVTCEVGG